MNDLKDRVKVNKRGILLISTLFFVLVLIMMSVALFALTRANYADMKSFYSENEAINNAESAINIASFIIASQPSLLTINSDGVNLGSLSADNNTNIVKRINSNNYRICVLNLKDKIVISNDSTINNNFNRYFNVVGSPSKIMVALVISPRNRNLTDSGAILFFGNNTGSSNTYKKDDANAVAVNFNNNRINFNFSNNVNYPNISGISYPLYTSVNNANNDVDITGINGYRNANKYTVLLMAMGYSKVPNTNRYVVRYVDQKLTNGGLLSASAYANGTMTIDTTNNIFSISDNATTNKLIAKNFNITLRDSQNNPSKQTLFKLTNNQDAPINGSLIVKQDSGNGLSFDGTNYTKINDPQDPNNSLLGQGRENTVESAIKADVSFKDKNANTSKIRDSLANLVKSKFSDPNNYVTLPAGYYIFVDSKKVVYFPSTMSITDVQNALDSINVSSLSDGINPGVTLPPGYSFPNDINIDEYQIKINNNVKIISDSTGNNNFFFVSSFGKVNDSDSEKYFANKNVQIFLGGNQGSIVYGENLVVAIDGVIKGQGTFAILNDDPSNPSTVSNAFAVDYTVDYTNNGDAFYPYRYGFTDPTTGTVIYKWVNYNGNDISILDTNTLKSGSMVVRFDQVKSSDNKLALIVDNDLYINPLSYNIQDLNWFDQMLAYSLVNWATGSTNNTPNIRITKGNNNQISNNKYNTAFQYLFDRKKWDSETEISSFWGEEEVLNFDIMWGANSSTNRFKIKFKIKDNYKAIINSKWGDNKLNGQIYRYKGKNIDPNNPPSSSYGLWDGNPQYDDYTNSHLLIFYNVNGYTIKLYGKKKDDSTSDVTLIVSGNGANYSSTLTMNKDAALVLLDSIDGTANDGSENFTMAKLAWITTAFLQKDPKIIEDVIGSNKIWDTVTNRDGVYTKSKDFAKGRLDGLYNSYLNVLNQKGWNNNLPISDNPQPNSNYFPFLYKNFVGNNPNRASYSGALNNLKDSPSITSSLLASSGFSERDVKLQGMVFVGNNLKAKTGTTNNLLFQGNLIVGNTKITNSGNVNIKGVKNTTFFFDLNSIDVNLLAGSVITLVPVLYRQESVISK